MRVLASVTLEQYADHFLNWEKEKHREDERIFADLGKVTNALKWMRESSYLHAKLPQMGSAIRLCALERFEVEGLRVPPHIVNDKWMAERGLWMTPPSPVILEIARVALDRDYFNNETNRDTGQYKRYWEWKARRSLEGAIGGAAATLLYRDEQGFLVVKDGWGRFLGFHALLLEKHHIFATVQTFIAF